MKYVLNDKKLMPHTVKKSDKILAVALGWALTEIAIYKVIRLAATQLNEESIRIEILMDALSSILDFIRVVGVAYLVEKLTRRSWKSFTTYLYAVLLFVTLMTEYCSTEMDRQVRLMADMHKDSLFDNDRNGQLLMSPEFRSVAITGFLVKGATAALSLGAN